ncbi:MbcA/ParS/Xre antitoxin family protein [Rhizobium sp. XQZ8]|uniref:MbcA/ParS/Xre antitoxin family protein n=1 Tax=Rhizobium populisoli TaxID=2859785 RepID=UPI001C67A722|nr:MbcA/ParS/Xre antitoxin family protein [Rhizobium populisoli]MBW6420616.1 MbcA/ParS/Xre antitoxin family protein [Rhizobium populisoli]
METAPRKHDAADIASVALKAFGNVMSKWGIPLDEAAALADMSESTWKRAKKPGYSAALGKDQLLRLSAIIGIYKALKLYFSEPIASRWMTLPNQGPLFNGARPVDTLIEEGLPQFLRVRNYLDALRGGA